MADVPAETMTGANGADFVSSTHCELHTRSTFNILSLCLSTLVISVWNAVHHDVPFPDTPRWRVYVQRLQVFFIGLVLPEVLVFTALNQFIAARHFLKEMSSAQGVRTQPGPACSALTASYWTEAWRSDALIHQDNLQWTMTHGFFAVMRGFVAKSSSGERAILSPDMIAAICKSDSTMRLLFAARGIEDHSKAGAIAKALFCWQLLVFAITCTARWAESLPLSLLEITTLAHSLCGLAAFALWWHKPHSVGEAIIIPIDDSLKEKVDWRSFNPSDEDAIEGLGLILSSKGDEPKENELKLAKPFLTSLAVASLYGLPHLLALGTEFPSLSQRRYWQVATAVIVGAPPPMVVLVKLVCAHHVRLVGGLLVYILCFAYLIASCFIIVESFRQLSALPSGAFLSPALVCYLPNFS